MKNNQVIHAGNCTRNSILILALVLGLLILPLDTTLGQGWESQTSGTTQNLRGVSFSQAAAGTAVGEGAVILRTVNQGATWTPQSAGLSDGLLGVSFADDNTGVAVGYSGTILNTDDGGSTWNIHQTGWMATLYAAHMLSPVTGYAIGQNTIFAPYGMKTTDGWRTSSGFSFYLKDGPVFVEGTAFDLHFLDGNTGFAACTAFDGRGAVTRTQDGGATWDTVHWTKYGLQGIDFPSDNVGYAVGNNGTILKSTDGGATWQLLTNKVFLGLTDLDFPNNYLGTVVGYGGTILRTMDGGVTWSAQSSGVAGTLRGVDFPEPNKGFIVGDNGLILHTTDGGGSTLLADSYGLSAGAGGVINFDLAAGVDNGNRFYIMLGSLSGTSPGLNFPQVHYPLNWDFFTDLILGMVNSPALTDFKGTLGATGSATAKLDTMGSLPPSAVGAVIYFAYLVYYPVDFASNPVAIEIGA